MVLEIMTFNIFYSQWRNAPTNAVVLQHFPSGESAGARNRHTNEFTEFQIHVAVSKTMSIAVIGFIGESDAGLCPPERGFITSLARISRIVQEFFSAEEHGEV